MGSLANAAQATPHHVTNFDTPGSGSGAGAGTGTNMNGIANNGAAVGFGIANNGNFTYFIRNPNRSFTTLNSNGNTHAMALGINITGDVAGTDENGNAFFLPNGGMVQTFLISGSTSSTAFGINDTGNIVGQFTTATATPGFFLANSSSSSFITLMPPQVRTPSRRGR